MKQMLKYPTLVNILSFYLRDEKPIEVQWAQYLIIWIWKAKGLYAEDDDPAGGDGLDVAIERIYLHVNCDYFFDFGCVGEQHVEQVRDRVSAQAQSSQMKQRQLQQRANAFLMKLIFVETE